MVHDRMARSWRQLKFFQNEAGFFAGDQRVRGLGPTA